MRKDCECSYCKNNVNEYFCSTCFHNFNECESYYKYDGITVCPKCHPYKEKFGTSPVKDCYIELTK